MFDLALVLSGLSVDAAHRLLGGRLIREINGKMLIGKIVETEAYDQSDAASHSYKGETPRTRIMFGPAGFAYVYFTYGMHYCFNVTTGLPGHGSAVLIRALEPLAGIETMQQHRAREEMTKLTNGPAKLCQALAIDRTFNGHNLTLAPLRIDLGPQIGNEHVIQTTRIGITRDTDKPWRFYIKDSSFVSKP